MLSTILLDCYTYLAKCNANTFSWIFQVVLSACILCLVFGGGIQMCQSAKTSSQPHRLVPLANGMSQLAMTLTLLMIAVILPMVTKLRYAAYIAYVIFICAKTYNAAFVFLIHVFSPCMHFFPQLRKLSKRVFI
jgi:predicted small integral membrane protein